MTQRVININDDFCKLLKNSVYYTLFICLIISQTMLNTNPIFAENKFTTLDTMKTASSLAVFNLEREKISWENDVKARYSNGKIFDVTDGVKHIKLTNYINAKPVKINVLEINKNLNPELELTPILAGEKLSGKKSIRGFAGNGNILAAVNGTYFAPPTGIPLGTLMINGKLETGPIYNRVALGVFEKNYKMARVELNAKVKAREGKIPKELKIDNVNQPRMLSTYVLVYTPRWGQISPPTPKYGVQIAVKNNKIIEISDGALSIPENGYVISGPKEKLQPFFNVQKLDLEINTIPEWEDVKHIISGGPYLVKEGDIFIDTAEQKLASVTGRNPRTAVGITESGNLVMVTVDGREESSIGMTLYELARLMKSFGCTEAMNLDGGGSSVMYLNGNIVNTPSIKGGIALSNVFALTINKNTVSYSE